MFWAFIYNLIGIFIVVGFLFLINGFELDFMLVGVVMVLSFVLVVANSLCLK